MSKITPDHLRRAAYVYIRQSSIDQVQNNRESQRRQYGLIGRARDLGWTDVVVIDDDLAISGSGVRRPGFERLLAAICEGRVGVVLTIEVSRLARNGRDWHTLLEFCGIIDCLIVDEDSIYDPRLVNDRLVLGMKGTMSEMELSVMRQRLMEARKFKARRGELFSRIVAGYCKLVNEDRIEKDPDRRVQEAIELAFKKFSELQSIRQVHRWLRREGITLPKPAYGPHGRHIVWELPGYWNVHGIITNPVYAGAYSYGRSTYCVRLEDGRKRVYHGQSKPRDEWQVLILDHHEGYISWGEFERNQALVANNAGSRGLMVRRAVRKGAALLNGILRCGHCGHKMWVRYARGTHRYACEGGTQKHGGSLCISFGAARVDQAVSDELLHIIQPLGVDAALNALAAQEAEVNDRRRQIELALQQARFESDRARRQYDAVEPENRVVVAELERRWNQRLLTVHQLEAKLEQLDKLPRQSLSETERSELVGLGTDLERAWNHPAATAETRKRILRTLLVEIVASVVGNEIHLLLHWQGGDHTQIKVIKPRSGEHRWTLDSETTDIIRELARLIPDHQIAGILNRAGKRTGRDNTWTEARVRTFRNDHNIPVHRPEERAERGEVNIVEAARILGTSRETVRRLIAQGRLEARQACPGAPWAIKRAALATVRLSSRCPVTHEPGQKALEF